MSTTDWDNILKLLMLTLLSEGREYERQVDTFVGAAMKVHHNLEQSSFMSERRSIEWYISHCEELKDVVSGNSCAKDLNEVIKNLQSFPDKKPLLRAIRGIVRDCRNGGERASDILKKSKDQWGVA